MPWKYCYRTTFQGYLKTISAPPKVCFKVIPILYYAGTALWQWWTRSVVSCFFPFPPSPLTTYSFHCFRSYYLTPFSQPKLDCSLLKSKNHHKCQPITILCLIQYKNNNMGRTRMKQNDTTITWLSSSEITPISPLQTANSSWRNEVFKVLHKPD